MNDRPSRKWWFSMVFHTLNTQRVAKWLVFRRLWGEFLYPGILELDSSARWIARERIQKSWVKTPEIIRWLATTVSGIEFSTDLIQWKRCNHFFYGEVHGFWFFLKSVWETQVTSKVFRCDSIPACTGWGAHPGLDRELKNREFPPKRSCA